MRWKQKLVSASTTSLALGCLLVQEKGSSITSVRKGLTALYLSIAK